MALAVGILAIVLGLLIKWWYNYFYKFNKSLKHFPGPPPIPILGNALEFKSSTEILPSVLRLSAKYGGIVKLKIGLDRPFLFICDYNLTEFVLSSTKILDKSLDYSFMHNWLGTGLLTSTGSKWKSRRKIITPTFHFSILEQFIDIFESAGDILVKKLYKVVGETSVDIYPYITLCTLDIICETAMGTSVNAQEDSSSKYVRSVKEMCRIVMDRSFSPLKQFDTLYRFSRDYQKEKKCVKILHDYTDSVIKRKREELLNKQNVDNGHDDVGIKKRMAFLDLLLQATVEGEGLSDLDIREEVDTFMFEGHDTTASAISFSLFCLAKNPEIQKKAVEEVNVLYNDQPNKSITYEDLQEMKYLEMVIKETVRLYPSVPIFGRDLMEDVEYDGNILPTGLSLGIIPYAIHRQEKYFPDPEKFDPDRFNLENSTNRPPYCYVPFSAGSRNCIGQKFAMLEMKSTVAKVLRHFELLTVVPEHKPLLAAETVLKSKNGILIRLKKRE